MDTTNLKHLNDCIRQLSGDLKCCRAAQQILDGYARLNSSGDGIVMAIAELQAAADEFARHSRHFAKTVCDLSVTVTTTSTTNAEEMQQ